MQLNLDPGTTALVLIDLQKGILGRSMAPHGADAIVEKAATLGRRLVEAGGIVVLVKVAFATVLADRPQQSVDEPMQLPQNGLPPEWSELAVPIAALPAAVVITKRQWGAFFGTELDVQLRRRGISTLVLGGIATNFGVEQTAREAWQHHYAVLVAEDITASVSEEMHRFSIEKIMPRIARVVKSADVLAALG